MAKFARHLFHLTFLFWMILCCTECGQYPYDAPLPGTLEVRIRTVSNNIPYSPLNTFPVQLTTARAILANNAKLDVYADLHAIKRDPSAFDAFSADAFDSALVIGDVESPPGTYIGLDLILQPVGYVVLDGYRAIPVSIPLSDVSFVQLLRPISVEQLKTTVVTVTFDVDSSLSRGAESYKYKPYFYISSIRVE